MIPALMRLYVRSALRTSGILRRAVVSAIVRSEHDMLLVISQNVVPSTTTLL